jgi:hypothetical protein
LPLDEDVRDRVRALANAEAFQQSCRERKKVEMRSARNKRIFKLDRLRLRGLNGVRDEGHRAELETTRQASLLPMMADAADRGREDELRGGTTVALQDQSSVIFRPP